jgi:ABC-type dipeptide/oligopeptide/nickel transport system ATPase component
MDNEKQALLEVKNLSVDFQVDKKLVLHAVRDVSFELDKGETLGILGESGCGKSVSCMSILKLNPSRTTRYQGQILFKGQDLLTMDPKALQKVRGNEISMIFQEPMTALNPLFTIGYQLREAIRVHNKSVSRAEAEDRVMAAIESVRIPNPKRIIDSYPFTLSGGMLQRCMIAMAMLSEPSILICDEPTTALDVTVQAQIIELLKRINVNRGIGLLFISHDLHVVRKLCTRVAVMHDGCIVETGPTEEVFHHPQDDYTKRLIAAIPTREKRKRANG